MKYNLKMVDEVDIFELDYGDTFVFREDPDSVYMIANDSFADFTPDIRKMVSEYLDEKFYGSVHFYISLDSGKFSFCSDCKVIPVRADNEINFVPDTWNFE